MSQHFILKIQLWSDVYLNGLSNFWAKGINTNTFFL